MKTLNIYKLILLFATIAVFNSCVEDDDFDTPNLTIVEPNIPANQIRTLASLAGDLAQEQGNTTLDYNDENTTLTYSFNENDEYITGYVVSSDEAGNFFEELIIQDNFENPSIGIKLLIDVNPLYIRYEVGRKVYVKINGLSVGITNGVLTLGALNGIEVDKISSVWENDVILRSSEVASIVPLALSFSDFADDKTNIMVQLQNVQFNRDQVINNYLTYASEQLDEFDGERILESCVENTSAVFSTSTFADFKGLALPNGQGNMNAILTKNFFGDTFNIVVNTPEDISFGGVENRCDPDFLECTTPGGGGATTIFEEDFESFGTFTSEGWTNVNINGGNTDWVEGSFSGNRYAQISGFNSNEDPIETWLVTPAINMDTTTNEELTMNIQTNFNNGDILSIWVSTDFSGDPTTATWQLLDAVIPAGSANGFGVFEPVQPINISCLDGNIHIGFLYEGADPGATTRYHVDDVTVTGN